MKPYPQDRRDIFCQLLAGGMTIRLAARYLGVSESTGKKWGRRWRETGVIEAEKGGGRRPQLLEPEHEWLVELVSRESNLTLHMILARLKEVRQLEVSHGTLWRYLRNCGFTYTEGRAARWTRVNQPPPAKAADAGGDGAEPPCE